MGESIAAREIENGFYTANPHIFDWLKAEGERLKEQDERFTLEYIIGKENEGEMEIFYWADRDPSRIKEFERWTDRALAAYRIKSITARFIAKHQR